MNRLWPALLAAVTLAPGAASAAGVLVRLDPVIQRKLGVATAPLAAERRTTSAQGFARVLDPLPLATLDADIAAAQAALGASQAEAARTRTLAAADQTVSRHVAETAAAQARADASRLTLLRRRLGLEWGPSLARLPDRARGRLVGELAAGRAALVRIDSAAGPMQARGPAAIDLGPSGVASATLLGPSRIGDARLQSTGMLGLVRGPLAQQLGVGMTASASIAVGAQATRVVIPRAAVLRTGGQAYAYVRLNAASFERRPLLGASSDPAGLSVASGFRAGEPVVVSGAAQLFAAESPSRKEAD